MIKKVAQFYLLAMGLAFAITLFLGSATASVDHVRIVMFALLSWPLAALILLVGNKMRRLREV